MVEHVMKDVMVADIRVVLLRRVSNNSVIMKWLLVPLIICFFYSMLIWSVYFAVLTVILVVFWVGLNLSIKIDNLRLDLMR